MSFWLFLVVSCWVLIGSSPFMFYNLWFASSFIKDTLNFTNRVGWTFRANKLKSNGWTKYSSSVFSVTEEPHFRGFIRRPTFYVISFDCSYTRFNYYLNIALKLTILSLFVLFCAVKRDLIMTDLTNMFYEIIQRCNFFNNGNACYSRNSMWSMNKINY